MHIFKICGISSLIISVALTSSCATAFVRSDSGATPRHIYPATTFDAQFLWEASVKGEPLLAPATEPGEKNGPISRLIFAAAGIIDLPFSIGFDTLLLPFDLILRKSKDDIEETEEDTSTDLPQAFP